MNKTILTFIIIGVILGLLGGGFVALMELIWALIAALFWPVVFIAIIGFVIAKTKKS